MAPRIDRLLESALYVDDVRRSTSFYHDVLGFEPLFADERICALSVAARQVLLVMKKGAATEPMPYRGSVIPPNDGSGELHVAFAVAEADLEAWAARLREHDVAIESRVHWERGGQSIYFRDPDGHLLELVTPGCWPIY